MIHTRIRSWSARKRHSVRGLSISSPLLVLPHLSCSFLPAIEPVSPQSFESAVSSIHCSKPADARVYSAVIVLATKYRFVGLQPCELSLEKRLYVRLLDRMGNGWLRVQLLDEPHTIGYIPASYTEIVVNDGKDPISLEWLHGSGHSLTTTITPVLETFACPLQVDAYPVGASVLLAIPDLHGQLHFKMRFDLPQNESIFVARTYHSMYELHVRIYQAFPAIQLPQFPAALLRQLFANATNSILLALTQRHHDLDQYWTLLLAIPQVTISEYVAEFVRRAPCVHKCDGNYDFDALSATLARQLERGNMRDEAADDAFGRPFKEDRVSLRNRRAPSSPDKSAVLWVFGQNGDIPGPQKQLVF